MKTAGSGAMKEMRDTSHRLELDTFFCMDTFLFWLLFFGFGMAHERHMTSDLFRPIAVPLFALNLNQRLVMCYFNYRCSLCQHGKCTSLECTFLKSQRFTHI